jgi:hypothetical protein
MGVFGAHADYVFGHARLINCAKLKAASGSENALRRFIR